MALTRLGGLLTQKIRQAIAEKQEALATQPVRSYEAYLQAVGYLQGLRDAIAHLEEIEGDDK